MSTFEWTDYNRKLLRREQLMLLDLEKDEAALREWHQVLRQIDIEFLKLRDRRDEPGRARTRSPPPNRRKGDDAGPVSRRRSSSMSDLFIDEESPTVSPPSVPKRGRTHSESATRERQARRIPSFGWLDRRRSSSTSSKKRSRGVKFGPVEARSLPQDDDDAGCEQPTSYSDDDIRYNERSASSAAAELESSEGKASGPPATAEEAAIEQVIHLVRRSSKPPTYMTIKSKLVQSFGQDVFDRVALQVKKILRDTLNPKPITRKPPSAAPPVSDRASSTTANSSGRAMAPSKELRLGPSHYRAACSGLNPTSHYDAQFVLSAAHTAAIKEHSRIVAEDTLDTLLENPGFEEWLVDLFREGNPERNPRAVIWDFLTKAVDVPKQTASLVVDCIDKLKIVTTARSEATSPREGAISAPPDTGNSSVFSENISSMTSMSEQPPSFIQSSFTSRVEYEKWVATGLPYPQSNKDAPT
eukprot:m.74668 g.74668  ORF g.74668 m.74668 type:complete len:471 (+) comp10323_c0_seq1:226-1638(+)